MKLKQLLYYALPGKHLGSSPRSRALDTPMDKENVGEHVFLHAFERSQRYLYITTPYLMVGDELLAALKFCARSGVDVRMITPCIPDKKPVHFTTRS